LFDNRARAFRIPIVPRPRRPTLAQIFLAATLVLTAMAAVVFFGFAEASRTSILANAERLRASSARRIEKSVRDDIGEAPRSLVELERHIKLGALDVDDPEAIESALFVGLADAPLLAELTFTRATKLGVDDAGKLRLAPARWQVSVYRASADPKSGVQTLITRREGEGFVALHRNRAPGAGLEGAPLVPAGVGEDPATHPTFLKATAPKYYGKSVPRDLHWSDLDLALPEAERRIVVTVQKAIEARDHDFVGVLRVGLLTQTVDVVSKLRVNDDDPNDPHRVFICDEVGKLVTRLSPDDRFVVEGKDLRVAPDHVPPPIAAALASPLLKTVSTAHPEVTGDVVVDGVKYKVTFRAFLTTVRWNIGIVVPEAYYTRDEEALRNRFLVGYLLALALGAIGGMLALRAVQRSLGRIVETTTRMRDFDFAAADSHAPFRDVEEVIDGLEHAKTAMRALGKYVPIDLVRDLYRSNREPELGGELMDVSVMFTDLEGFTGLSERLTPDDLARALGQYLDTMTSAIQKTQGTIDKFIGDAVMTIWNAPSPVEAHAKRACRAVLDCMAATRALYASPAWGGLPPLHTRFGLNKAIVSVGHFGAHDRLSYTAIGDGVNLASRLESACKQYGISVLVSEAIEEAARDEFRFRVIDVVAVKGKRKGVRVYELLGEVGDEAAAGAVATTYEEAFAAYSRRDFAGAMKLLERQVDADPPSKVLAERCRRLLAAPPPDDWDGVFVATSK
jgi:adenylate cyclase